MRASSIDPILLWEIGAHRGPKSTDIGDEFEAHSEVLISAEIHRLSSDNRRFVYRRH